MSKLYFKYYLPFFLLLILFTSCKKDELACFIPNDGKDIKIYFSYEPKDDTEKVINPSDVKSITLFVFDENGKFVLSKTEKDISLDKGFYITTNLRDGNYSFVVWGNLEGPYYTIPSTFEVGITNISSSVLYLKRPQSEIITNTIPPLFYGSNSNVSINDSSEDIIIIPLIQNTNRIKVIVNGLQPNDDEYYYTITDNNSKYYFNNTFAPDAQFSYASAMTFNSENQLTASLNVLRLAANRVAELHVSNRSKDKSIFKHDLIDLLIRLENQSTNVVDWENTNDYEIVITYHPDLEITVTINGWDVITDQTELP